jgi:hypothetical protein
MSDEGEGMDYICFSESLDFDGMSAAELSKVAVSFGLSPDADREAVINVYRKYRREELGAVLDMGC